MADEIITLRMEGNKCTASIPDGSDLRVKFYAPRRQFPVLEGKTGTCAIQLLPGETMHIDAYGEGGEGRLLSVTYALLTEQGLKEQRRIRGLPGGVQVIVEASFNPEKAIADYTELMRRIQVGAYEERSVEHHLTGTWPEDGVEESIANLENLAARQGLQFVWHQESSTYTLEPMSPEDLQAQEREDTRKYITWNLGGE